MPFVKVVKNKAYFKRYQVKFRRRREGRTDYRQRHKLITQDKNKYQSPKYRLVVRITNKYVYVQIIYAELDGDKVMCQASSKELPRYGLKVGLKNYSAGYCTGLLIARRLLKQVDLDEIYTGVEEPDGEVNACEGDNGKTYYVPELDEESEKKPFRALLDVGIANTTTGSRVFAVMKGASDGGLDIPHSNKRFPGYSRDTKTYDAEVLKGHIMGEHVADYMREMEEDDEENYQKHFAKYVEEDIEADDLEELYEKVHSAIREDPEHEKAPAFTDIDKSYKKGVKKTYEQRKADSSAKKAALRPAAEEEDDEEMDEEEAAPAADKKGDY
jgi:large subunit ribosomal protein L5e